MVRKRIKQKLFRKDKTYRKEYFGLSVKLYFGLLIFFEGFASIFAVTFIVDNSYSTSLGMDFESAFVYGVISLLVSDLGMLMFHVFYDHKKNNQNILFIMYSCCLMLFLFLFFLSLT